MWNYRIVKFSFVIFIVLIGHILCEEDDVKVMEINGDNGNNSAVTHIQYENNGHFVSPKASDVVTRRIAAYDQQMIGQCGGIYRNIQNLIESPKFISAHPICSLRCEYQIISPYVCENEFHVQFLEFSIDSSVNCERDRVVINHEDELCGKIVGVKKYRTEGGVLNITFSAASWDSTEKGFRLIVTRLPCVDDLTTTFTTELISDDTTTESSSSFHTVNSSYTVESPHHENQHPIYGVPYGYNLTDVELNNRQDIPVIPLPHSTPPTYPQRPVFTPPPPPIFPPLPTLPQCCRNTYNQQRFLLYSQGFPALTVLNNDCVFVIHKSSPNACRLRIHFKYFLLDDIQQQQQVPGQLGCFNNFIEIDGQRICGCKTNFVYETQWGFEPKVIRLHTRPGNYFNAQGFVLDIEQQDCPFKLETSPNENVRIKRTLLTKFLLKKHFTGSHLSPPPSHQLPPFPHHNIFNPLQHHHQRPPLENVDIDGDDAFRSKFFIGNYNNENSFINSATCSINHLRLLQLKIESFGVFKHYCLPSF